MKRLFLILVSFAWLPIISAEVRACSCLEYDMPVCAAYWRADAVFAGQLLDITPVEKTADPHLNPRNEAPGDGHAPYARTYYPNVPEASAATKIVITEGAKLENLTLHVGSRLKERTVSGKVVWEDGRLATSAGYISVYDGERNVRTAKLDEKGRFNFKVYGDFKYEIVAESWGKIIGKSERVAITNERSTRLTLVLKTQ